MLDDQHVRCHDKGGAAWSPFVCFTVDRQNSFFSSHPVVLASFITSLSRFFRFPSPILHTSITVFYLLISWERFLLLPNGISFLWRWIFCRTCSPPAVTKLLEAQDTLHSNESGNFSLLTRWNAFKYNDIIWWWVTNYHRTWKVFTGIIIGWNDVWIISPRGSISLSFITLVIFSMHLFCTSKKKWICISRFFLICLHGGSYLTKKRYELVPLVLSLGSSHGWFNSSSDLQCGDKQLI